MMLTLLQKEEGPCGAWRHWQHPRLGVVETVTVWKDPGAHVVHVMHWRKAEVDQPRSFRKPAKKRKSRAKRAACA
jgi:hypothetical protein